MDSEDVYVMGVSDAKHYTFNRKAVGSIISRRSINTTALTETVQGTDSKSSLPSSL